jgi:hypothetical protein
MKNPIILCLFALVPLLSLAQKINVKGILVSPKSDKILFERLKRTGSGKVWKGSEYEGKIDSNGAFSLSFPISDSGFWKITVGNKRLKLLLNANQNLYLDLDSNLAIKKIIRQDWIDSPLPLSF